MLKVIFYILLFIGTVLQLGCKQEFDDVSAEAPFSQLIGLRYESLVNLRVRGITTDNSHSSSVDFYYLSSIPKVEHKGPEVVVTLTLMAGAKFKVLKVIKCNNCLFSPPAKVVVAIQTEEMEPEKPVLVMPELIDFNVDGGIAMKPTFLRAL